MCTENVDICTKLGYSCVGLKGKVDIMSGQKPSTKIIYNVLLTSVRLF